MRPPAADGPACEQATPRLGEPPLGAFRPVPRTGVIYVSAEARAAGWRSDDPNWCNLGQGQPETGHLPGAPPRCTSAHWDAADQDYAPVDGLWELREAIADLYNHLHRRGLASRYRAENVAVCAGGRVGLMRACAAVAPVHLGHFLPDYTAYEELLDVFRRFQPVPIALDPEERYHCSPERLRKEILGRGLGALLLSNPCNPTGKLLAGRDLAAWVDAASALHCAMIFDEFYSHYVWDAERPIVSAAAFVKDVDRDPVLVLDGLTKNWRYPSWRICWVLGPRAVVEAISSAGSFLDGGAPRPLQRAALPLLDPEATLAETHAIQRTFSLKRAELLSGLQALGIRVDPHPAGTFYAWGDVSDLPPPLDTAEGFFRAALQRQVITVPGPFFDVDPGRRRVGRPSRFARHVRFSFGPPMPVLRRALGRLAELLDASGAGDAPRCREPANGFPPTP